MFLNLKRFDTNPGLKPLIQLNTVFDDRFGKRFAFRIMRPLSTQYVTIGVSFNDHADLQINDVEDFQDWLILLTTRADYTSIFEFFDWNTQQQYQYLVNLMFTYHQERQARLALVSTR